MYRNQMRIAICFAILLAVNHVALAQSDVELAKLKVEVAELREEVNSGLSRLEKSIQVHGFISQGYMRSTDNNYITNSDSGSFEFNEVGINFMTTLSDNLHAGVQLFSRDLGELGNNKVDIDWAYGDYHWQDWFGVRAGRVKLPTGQYNEARDIDATRTSVLLPQSVYREAYRDLMLAMNGILSYGEIPLDMFGSLGYQTWIGGMSIDTENSSHQQTIEDEIYIPGVGWVQMVDLDEVDVDYVTGLSLDWSTPLDGLRLTGSYLNINNITSKSHTMMDYDPPGPAPIIPAGTRVTTSGSSYKVYTFGGEYSAGDLTIAGEYRKQDARFYQTPVPPAVLSIHSSAWYLFADYQFTSKFAAGTSYSEVYGDRHDKDGDRFVALGRPDYEAWQKDIGLYCRYDVTDNFSMKAEVHSMNGTAQLRDGQNQQSQGQEKNWIFWLVKFSYNF